MKTKCWIAVDKDGTEKVSNSILIRRIKYSHILFGLIKIRYSKNDYRKWGSGWSTNDNDALPYHGTILPKGSIEKLIGRKMTWNDEPIEISV